MKKVLPIGYDNFREIREDDHFYYVDKSLFIKEFMEYKNKVALITRPRRFGKTMNMSMLSEFFDITKDSQDLFDGLAIMGTEYVEAMNSRTVIFISLKDCSANSSEKLKSRFSRAIFSEYRRYYKIFEGKVDFKDLYYVKYMQVLESLKTSTVTWEQLEGSIYYLMTAVAEFFDIPPILLIDEYDQPIISSYEYGYREEMGSFFEGFYGLVLKGNEYLSQALLTGIQRVAKESVFSKLNNVIVYTVLNPRYQEYFGLNEKETKELLEYYDLELTQEVKQQYDGYIFGNISVYNPWSILNYAYNNLLDNYWINTSTNALVINAILSSGELFRKEFEQLLSNHKVAVGVELETSFLELENSETLWGLLINAGYLTVIERKDIFNMTVTIPNNEVKHEFQKMVAKQANISGRELNLMMQYLINQDMESFYEVYSNIVLTCTSYFDARENAYHMLFLGMCISLKDIYSISSNIETGYGRSDITLESLSPNRPHMVIEFKQGDNTTKLKSEALEQIFTNNYYAGLKGKILCIGIAHNKKRCEIEHKMIQI